MIDARTLAGRLQQAVARERITAANWRARRCDDTAAAWFDAVDAVDCLIQEVAGREQEASR